MRFIYEAIFLGTIIGIADIQAEMIAKGQTIRHFWWGSLFALLIAGAWWLEDQNYWFAAALVIEHFIFFSPILNWFRRPSESFFYIHSDSGKGSIWDNLLKPVEKYYPYIWGASVITFGFLQSKL